MDANAGPIQNGGCGMKAENMTDDEMEGLINSVELAKDYGLELTEEERWMYENCIQVRLRRQAELSFRRPAYYGTLAEVRQKGRK